MEKKFCKKCNQEKEFSEFRKNVRDEEGYRKNCKTCEYGHEPYKKPTIDKICTVCKELKLIEEYGFINKAKEWRESKCKKCKNRYLDKRKKEKGYKKPKEALRRIKARTRYKKYNITEEEFLQLLKDQDSKCKICKKGSEDCYKNILAIDHCHTTGKVRGLLCTSCNTGLGGFKDNQELLLEAVKYLTDSKSEI